MMEAATPKAPLFTLSAAVFVQRAEEILILKRAGGEATGGWYLPGGAVDAGETVEESARRELFEEAGLVPSGPLTCVAVAHMHVYGHQSLQVLYACDCAEGDVVLSHEHTEARWTDPVVYRDRYLGGDIVQGWAASNPRAGEMLANISRALDAYLDWRALRRSAGL